MLLKELTRSGVWEPFQEMEQLRTRLNHLIGSAWAPWRPDFPPVNVWATEEEAIVTAEIPGVTPEEIDISVVGDTLTLHGCRKPIELKERETYHRQERGYGDFTKAIELPFKVDANKIDAHFDKGVFYVKLPRTEVDKPKKIAIKSV